MERGEIERVGDVEREREDTQKRWVSVVTAQSKLSPVVNRGPRVDLF